MKLLFTFKTLSLIIFSCLILGNINNLSAQCSTNIVASRTSIACGESVFLQQVGVGGASSDDFSGGTLSGLWAAPGGISAGYTVGGPCGTNPSGGVHLWFGNGAAIPRTATTIPVDASCGGNICFDFRQETQGGACDGPDLTAEGVYLQYKTATIPWTTINYFNPVGFPFTGWQNHCFPIPALAQTFNTQFRWQQTNASSTAYDFWGIDNVNIATCAGYSSIWSGGNIPLGYSLDSITVAPLDTTTYNLIYTNGIDSCFASQFIDVDQPTIISSTIPAFCAGSDTLDAQATITANCNYSISLWNYLPGGTSQPGWSVGTSPQTYHNLDIEINSVLYSNYTMINGGNFTNFNYFVPVTDGDQLDAIFSSLGSNASECFYEVYDSQNNLLTTQGFPGFAPGNFSTLVTCPATANYSYSWQNITNGGVAGLSNPNTQNPLATVAVTTDFEVTAYDPLNPQCIAIDTVTVAPNFNSISTTLSGNTIICTPDPVILSFTPLPAGDYAVNLEITPLTGVSSNLFFNINEFGLVTDIGPFFGLPFSDIPTENTTYSILSITNILTGCAASVTDPTLLVTVNDPPYAGVGNVTITVCKNNGTDFYLPNSITGSPDLNGTWKFLGTGNPDPTLPFIGFNYLLDPTLFPTTPIGSYHIFEYSVAGQNGCTGTSSAFISAAILDAPHAGTLPVDTLKICLDLPSITGATTTPIDLNTLFNVTPSCPSCALPSPFTGNWTDVTGGTPGTIITPLASSSWTTTVSGTYTLRYTAATSIICPFIDFEEITILVSDLPTAAITTSDSDDKVCLNDNVNLIFSPTGIGPFEINYYDGSTAVVCTVDVNSNEISTNSPINISTTSAGSFTYTVNNIVDLGTGTAACSNPLFTSVTLVVKNPPFSGITTTNIICEDDFTLHNLNDPSEPFFPTGADAVGAWTFGFIPILSGTFQAADPSGNIIDPFGTYTYTVVDGLAICPNESTDITITAETPPNTGNAIARDICVNDFLNISNYDLSQLLDGSQDINGDWINNLTNTIVPAGIVDLSDPMFAIGTPATSTLFNFTYELTPPSGNSCTNNDFLPYFTLCNITIHPEPKIDPTTPTANPLVVPQTSSTNISVNMLEGTPPFTVNLQGNEIPIGVYAPFVISPGMSGQGSVTPNYDINNNPVTISIDSITDGNNCTTKPNESVDVIVDPYPEISVTASSFEQCEGLPLDIIFEGLQGNLDIEIDFSINGNLYSTAGSTSLNGITILNTQISSDISSLLSIGLNLIQIINVEDNAGIFSPTSLLPPDIEIMINSKPTISSFSSNSPICENEDAKISFNFNSGIAPFTINYNYSVNMITSTPTTQISCNNPHTEILALLANNQNPATGIPFPYHFYVTSFTDDNGCIGTVLPIIHELDLLVNEAPIISLSSFIPVEICEGEEISLQLQGKGIPAYLINPSIPAPPYNIEINGTLYFIDNVGNIIQGAGSGDLISYTLNSAGSYPFVITDFNDLNGCGIIDSVNNSATLTVNERANMIVTSTADTGEICKGNLAYINFEFTEGTAPWQVTLSKNGIPITLPSYSNSITIPQSLYTYETPYDIISLKDAKGCNREPLNGYPFNKDFKIIANPLPIAELYTTDRFLCNDGSTTEMIFKVNNGNPGYSVNYSVGLENKFLSINTNSPISINSNQIGIWKITEVMDSKGCLANEKGEKITINLNPTPIASFDAYPQPTDINNPFVNFIDNSSGHINAVWDFNNYNDNDTIANNLILTHEFMDIADTHFVSLNIISDSGCVSSITKEIFVNKAFTCYVPSSFTPNNDLFNDHFLPIIQGVNEYKLSIYNRAGDEIFETSKFTDTYCMWGCDEAWDGKANNSDNYVTEGQYAYRIKIIDFQGKERSFHGTVTLIR
jgi:gliding motility-associated-like protein